MRFKSVNMCFGSTYSTIGVRVVRAVKKLGCVHRHRLGLQKENLRF
jgi:hypothetical protein